MMENGLTVGQYLQKNREESKIPLESISRVTRIKLSSLQALERDDFHLLPAEAFTLGRKCFYMIRRFLVISFMPAILFTIFQ